MYKKILDKCINDNPSGYYIKESGFSKTWPNVYYEFSNYNFNSDIEDKSFKIRLWHFLNQINEIPKQRCGKSLKFINFKRGYNQFCQANCECMTEFNNKERKKTSIRKYGVSHPNKLKSIKNKISKTKLNYTQEKRNEINEKRKIHSLKIGVLIIQINILF